MVQILIIHDFAKTGLTLTLNFNLVTYSLSTYHKHGIISEFS